jgi:hypothetical protein
MIATSHMQTHLSYNVAENPTHATMLSERSAVHLSVNRHGSTLAYSKATLARLGELPGSC